jgi:plastocyanin
MPRLRLLAGVGLAASLIAGPWVDGAGAVKSGAALAPFKIAVAKSGLSYSPKAAAVKKGRKVKWTNQSGSATHTVTFYKKPKGAKTQGFTLGAGDSRTRKITKKGVYKYRCTILGHSSVSNGTCTGMCGKVRGT